MERRMRLSLALVLASLQFLTSLRLGLCTFDCEEDCFEPYLNFQPVSSCETVRTVIQCYNDNQEACDASDGGFFPVIPGYLSSAMRDYQILGCGDDEDSTTTSTIESFSGSGATPEPTTVLTQPACPTVPDIYIENPALSMTAADISPKLHPRECAMQRVSHLQQCSLFMDSQLRAFGMYRAGLEACSLPGAWFLFRHRSLSIEVEGTNLEPGYNHTRLTKIKVTFHMHDCNPVTRTYTAYNTEPLASQFTPSQSESTASPLQLMVGEGNDSVVTLMATWLNTSIIIRQYAQFLSVTLQVPHRLALEGEGLCTGCPHDLYINITEFNNRVSSMCPDDNARAIIHCFDFGGVANQFPLENVVNSSYLESCQYSMIKIKSAEVLTMFNAIAGDAALLMETQPPPTIPTLTNFTYVPAPPTEPTPSRNIQETTLVSTSDSSSSLQTQSFPALLAMIALSTLLLSVSR